MNKEAKIGLTIILVLLVTFVAVLAKRLYSSHAAEQTLAAEAKGEVKPEASANREEDAFNKVDKAKILMASINKPTVVAATAGSDEAPQGTASNEDLWSRVSDPGGAKVSTGSSSELKSRPSYMPEPPKPDAEDRYARYRKTDNSINGDDRRRYDSSPERSNHFTQADTADSRSGYRRGQASTSAGAGRTYIVAEGDSLFDIARNELGKASRWVEIYDLNAEVLGKDIDSLAPGTQIVLPADNARNADPLTRRPSVDYRKQ